MALIGFLIPGNRSWSNPIQGAKTLTQTIANTSIPYFHELGCLGDGLRIAVADKYFDPDDVDILKKTLKVIPDHFQLINMRDMSKENTRRKNHGYSMLETLKAILPNADYTAFNVDYRINSSRDKFLQTLLNTEPPYDLIVTAMNVPTWGDLTSYPKVVDQILQKSRWISSSGNFGNKHWKGHDLPKKGFRFQPEDSEPLEVWAYWQSNQNPSLDIDFEIRNALERAPNADPHSKPAPWSRRKEPLVFKISNLLKNGQSYLRQAFSLPDVIEGKEITFDKKTALFLISDQPWPSDTIVHLFSMSHEMNPSVQGDALLFPARITGILRTGAVGHTGKLMDTSSEGDAERPIHYYGPPFKVGTRAMSDFNATSSAVSFMAGLLGLAIQASPAEPENMFSTNPKKLTKLLDVNTLKKLIDEGTINLQCPSRDPASKSRRSFRRPLNGS